MKKFDIVIEKFLKEAGVPVPGAVMPGMPPPPPDPSVISAKTDIDTKQQQDPIQFAEDILLKFAEIGKEGFLKLIRELRLSSEKPLNLESPPIGDMKSSKDFAQSFEDTYKDDYDVLSRYINLTKEGSDTLKYYVNNYSKLAKIIKQILETKSATIAPSNPDQAPM